jgi:CubicO group peptidase (beta-lactamase class C family)
MTWIEQTPPALTEALRSTIDTDGVVVAAGAIDATGGHAAIDPGGTAADRRFEVGSVTKTMTATVLSLLAAQGKFRLDDPIGRWLSAGPNSALTVRQLATHTSGLPPLAPNHRARLADPKNPWAGYTFERAEADLPETPTTPGRGYMYSNLGYQLLGLILQRASGQAYPELLAERLFAPLSMTDTHVGQRDDGRLLPGHASGREVLRWDQPWGAGGVEATINDIIGYARACLFPPPSPLGAALTRAQTPVVAVASGSEQALAWMVYDGSIREHTGGTGGFSACVSVDHDRGRAVAILASLGGSPLYVSHLRQAARLALAGQDPRRTAKPQPWPDWREVAHDTARALLDGQVGAVHARLAAMMRDKITVDQLAAAWRSKARDAGPAQGIDVVRHEIAASGAVTADVEIAFAASPRRLRVMVLPSGELGGFTLLPPPGKGVASPAAPDSYPDSHES